MSDSNQNYETTYNSKLKFAEPKDFFIKRVATEKLVKNELCGYVANTVLLDFQFFSEKYHFRLWVFALTGEYFFCLH